MGRSPVAEAPLRGRILIVDDDASTGELLGAALARRGFGAATAASGEAALAAFAAGDFDAVLTDLNMPDASGVDLCARLQASRPDVPVILLTAFGSLETAIAAIRAGAYDFLTKPPEIDALVIALERAIQTKALRDEVKRLRRAVEGAQRFDRLLGGSAPMKALFALLEAAAASDASVVVTGETGTGKELVARALHQRGRRARGPFVATSCAALPEPLLESELFGHVRGAFTDARSAHAGLFLRANGGTLFLDEVGDMPLALQAKLLRALQERRARPVGGEAELPFDVRIVAATHRDLEAAVAARTFREDLFFRLNVIRVDVPPLRARGSDVLLIARSLVETFAARAGKPIQGITDAAAERLLAYAWPGNVRELENCIERAVALSEHDRIMVDDLPEKVRMARRAPAPVVGEEPSEILTLEEVERRHILRVCELTGGNKARAARLLGLDRATLYRRLERYAHDTRRS
jgi:two-component system response regulator HydG